MGAAVLALGVAECRTRKIRCDSSKNSSKPVLHTSRDVTLFFYFSSSLFIYNFNINLPFYQVHDYFIFSFNCLNPVLKSLSLLVLRCIMVSEAMLIVIIKRVKIYLEYSIKWLLTRCIIGYVSPA